MSQLAFKEATVKPVAEIAADLQETLGQRLVAYAAAVRSPKLVGRWAASGHKPQPNAEKQLRELYRAVLILREQYGQETIRAFMAGANPALEDRAPIEVIHSGEGTAAIRAAEAFLD